MKRPRRPTKFEAVATGNPSPNTACGCGGIAVVRFAPELVRTRNEERIFALPVALAADPQFGDQRSVSLNIIAAEVIEQAPPTPDQHQQASPRVMILFMGLQVLGQVLNALGEQSDLHLSGPRVGVVPAVLSDRCSFVRHARNSFPR